MTDIRKWLSRCVVELDSEEWREWYRMQVDGERPFQPGDPVTVLHRYHPKYGRSFGCIMRVDLKRQKALVMLGGREFGELEVDFSSIELRETEAEF